MLYLFPELKEGVDHVPSSGRLDVSRVDKDDVLKCNINLD